MNINTVTILYGLVFAELLFIAVFAITQKRHPQTKGPKFWAAGCACNALALSSMLIDSTTFSEQQFIVVRNLLYFGSAFFQWQGIRAFFNLPSHRKSLALAITLLTILQAAFIFVWVSTPARLIIQSVVTIALLTMSITYLVRYRSRAIRFECNILIAIQLVFSLFHVVRLLHAVDHFSNYQVFAYDPANFFLIIFQLPVLALLITSQIDEQRKQALAALAESENIFRKLFEESSDPTFLLKDGLFVGCNNTSIQFFGYATRTDLLSLHPSQISPPEQADGRNSMEKANEMIGTALAQGVHRFEWTHSRADGSLVPVEVTLSAIQVQGETLLHALVRDISERKVAEEAIRQLAFYDQLTGLPNRRLLLDRLKLAMSQADRDKTKVGFLAIDLDRFKPVNDNHGHDVGDMLLQKAGQRMQACLRQSDTICRAGGDEFVVLLCGLQSMGHGMTTANKIREVLNGPFDLAGGYRVLISSSSGLAIYPDHGSDHLQLAKCADIAMYRAKEQGRNTVELFSGHAMPGPQQTRLEPVAAS